MGNWISMIWPGQAGQPLRIAAICMKDIEVGVLRECFALPDHVLDDDKRLVSSFFTHTVLTNKIPRMEEVHILGVQSHKEIVPDIWMHYFDPGLFEAFVFILDGSDRSSWEEAKRTFVDAFTYFSKPRIPVLVMVYGEENRSVLQDASAKLDLEEIFGSARPWRIQFVEDGAEWLRRTMEYLEEQRRQEEEGVDVEAEESKFVESI